MKNFARLVIYFSVFFIITFMFFVLSRFLSSWILSVRYIANESGHAETLISAARTALAPALFVSILFSLNFSVKHKIPAYISIFLVFFLSGALYTGIFYGIERVKVYDPYLEIPDNFDMKAGFILSRLETDLILLNESRNPAGVTTGVLPFPRVISFPEQPLIYQETSLGPSVTLFNLPLDLKIPWFIESIMMDFTLLAREFQSRFNFGLFSFLIFGCALFYLLSSLRFIHHTSAWPLANIFLGALVFRLVLSLVIFIETREVREFLGSFIGNRIPENLITPAALFVLCFFVNLYTLLAFLARHSRRNNEN